MNVTRVARFALVVALGLSGCSALGPFRVHDAVAEVDCAPDTNGEVPAACRAAVRESTQDYDLLFVEFDDQGLQYPAERYGGEAQSAIAGQPARRCPAERCDRAPWQINDTLAHVKDVAGRADGVSLIVFVHGWQHNAAHDDENVKAFRTMLASAAAVEKSRRDPYRVVGLYVGWRGLSSRISPLRQLSFWTRKSAADHIAAGSPRELFARLRGLKCSLVREPVAGRECEEAPGVRPRMRLVLIGHSFGGLILYNAVSGALIESLARAWDTGEPVSSVPRYADLVVLLNPAFEATRYAPLHRIATTRAYAPAWEPPLFVSVTTSADWATGRAFPIGRQLNTFFQRHASREERQANRRTIGNMPPYVTHELTLATSPPTGCAGWVDPAGVPAPDRPARILENLRLEEANRRAFLRRQAGQGGLQVQWEREFCGGARLSHVQHNPRAAIWNVRADRSIMSGHDDIANPVLGHFLRQLYHDTVALPAAR